MRRSNEPRVQLEKIFNFFMGKVEGNFFLSRWYLSLFFFILLFMWRSTGKTYGKKWAQERGTDTQPGRRTSRQATNKELSGGIWDFVVRFGSRLLASRKGFLLDGLRCMGKYFTSMAMEKNDFEINLITCRGRWESEPKRKKSWRSSGCRSSSNVRRFYRVR